MSGSICNSAQTFHQHLVGKLGSAGTASLAAGVGIAAASLVLWIYYYIDSHHIMRESQITKVKSDLRKAQTDYEIREFEYLKKVEERMRR